MGDRNNPEDWRECPFPGCDDLVEWSEGQYRWLPHEHHKGRLLAYAYGASRSGKTTYRTPVIYVGEAPAGQKVLVQSFLFWPTEEDPEGELNAPTAVWPERLSSPDDCPWDRIEEHGGFGQGSPRRLFEALQEAYA